MQLTTKQVHGYCTTAKTESHRPFDTADKCAAEKLIAYEHFRGITIFLRLRAEALSQYGK